MAGDVFNYYDLDVLAIGPVADQVSTEFDTYWNASEAVPVIAFVEPDDSSESAEEIQRKISAVLEEAKTTPYIDALDSSIADLLLAENANQLVWAPARVVFDLPYGEISDQNVAGINAEMGVLIESVELAAGLVQSVCPRRYRAPPGSYA